MTAKLHEETLPGRYAGELYDQAVEESSNWVERWGWKFWRFAGDAVTLGGQSAQAENAAMYRRGEISLNAYRKNWVLAIGKVGFKAAMLALTGGRATGPAMRLLGLEGESVAATVVAGQAEGLVGGFVDAVSSDLYSKAIATFSSSPGVVAFHERSIVGPMGWIESASWGGAASRAVGLRCLEAFCPKRHRNRASCRKRPRSNQDRALARGCRRQSKSSMRTCAPVTSLYLFETSKAARCLWPRAMSTPGTPL
jgi:hypothetical protein